MSEPLPLVVANLKANKTWDEMTAWLEIVTSNLPDFSGTIVVCPSTPFLASTHQWLNEKGENQIKLGSQDISRFEQGAYTGEVAASQVASLVNYAIIGHSERRQNFNETDEILKEKVKNTNAAGIEPIFCVQDESTPIPEGVSIVAYEPVFAIGAGSSDDPQNIKSVTEKLKARAKYIVLYGGSVSAGNAPSIIPYVDGFLVATNSLNPMNFLEILKVARL